MSAIARLAGCLCLVSVLFGLASTAVAAEFGPTADKRANEIYAEVKDLKDKTPAALLDELGQMGTPEAFNVLKRCVREMRQRNGRQRVMSAMRFMVKDPDLGPKVLKFVVKEARSNNAQEARAAAGALSFFGPEAKPALLEVLTTASDPGARATALRPLRDDLAKRGDEETLELVLAAYRVPESGTRVNAFDLLRRFRTEDSFEALEDFVDDKRSPLAMRQMIVMAMGGHPRGEGGVVDEGADAVLIAGLKSRDDALQYYALSAMARRGGTAGIKFVDKLTDSKEPTVRRAAMLVAVVNKAKGFDPLELAIDRDSITRQAAAIALSTNASPEALAALHLLLHDEDRVVRSEAIRAMARQRDKSSIPALIERLEVEDGRLRDDIRVALQTLTARDYGLRKSAWRAFWTKEGDRFSVPSIEAVNKAAEERAKSRTRGDTSVAFYGLDIVSNRFALVIDTSGSMTAKAYTGPTRIDVAKEQLQKTLERLRDGVLFNVIPFSGAADPMQDGLVAMNQDEREDALAFSSSLRAAGGTNIYDALAAAFDDERVDTIYLMSDGAPSAGEITDATELRDEVARWNSVRGVRIHCIAVGQDHNLLKGLAADSGGRYVRVD